MDREESRLIIKMVFLDIYTAPNLTGGFDDLLFDIVTEVPVFTPMLLVFVFLTILIGGSINQKRRLGSADMPMWTVLAGISTLLVSLILSLREGLIQGEVLSIVVAITCFAGFWLFFDRNRNEI